MYHAWQDVTTPSKWNLAWSTNSWPIREFYLNNSVPAARAMQIRISSFFMDLNFVSYRLLWLTFGKCAFASATWPEVGLRSRRFRCAMNTVSSPIVSHREISHLIKSSSVGQLLSTSEDFHKKSIGADILLVQIKGM